MLYDRPRSTRVNSGDLDKSVVRRLEGLVSPRWRWRGAGQPSLAIIGRYILICPECGNTSLQPRKHDAPAQ